VSERKGIYLGGAVKDKVWDLPYSEREHVYGRGTCWEMT
jgi:hypothetical protein